MDYIGGAIPVAGDVLDIITLPSLFGVVQDPVVFFGAAEFVPGVDFLPTWTGLTAIAFYKSKKGGA